MVPLFLRLVVTSSVVCSHHNSFAFHSLHLRRLHYDDAASACLAALKVGPEVNAKRTFLISDGNPTTRKGICESALKCATYAQYSMPRFLGPDDGLKGKIYDGSKSNSKLDWKPTYQSFDSFMTSCV